MPCGQDAVGFAQRGDLAAGRDATDMRQIMADVIDQVLGDQLLALPQARISLAHSNWRAGLMADEAKRVEIFRRQRVLEIEELVGLKILCQLQGLAGRDPLVHVVQKLHAVPELFAKMLEQSW